MSSKYIEFSISQELHLLKNDDVCNNLLKLLKKVFEKFFPSKF